MRRVIVPFAAALVGLAAAVSPVGAEPAQPSTEGDLAISELLAQQPTWSLWNEIVTQAGLAETLSFCEGDTFVALVPTDDALAEFELDGDLLDLVLGHLLDGSAQMPVEGAGAELETLPGSALNVTATYEGLLFGELAKQTDEIVAACNGLLIPIDTVLAPTFALMQEAPIEDEVIEDEAMIEEEILEDEIIDDDEILDDEILDDEIFEDEIIDDDGDLPDLGASTTTLSVVGTAAVLAGFAMLRLRRRVTA